MEFTDFEGHRVYWGQMYQRDQVQCTHQCGAYNTFDGMTLRGGQFESTPNRVLKVLIHHACYPITETVLRQVFDPYGTVEEVAIFEGGVEIGALVQYHSASDAACALKSLQGRNIYDGCCRLDISYAPVLHVTIHHEFYPVTEEVLHRIFDAYGPGQKIQLGRKSARLEAFVPFWSCATAAHAREALHGRYIWDGCCLMEVQFATTDSSLDSLVMCSVNCSDTDTSADDCTTDMTLLAMDLSKDVPTSVDPSKISQLEVSADIKLDTLSPAKLSTVCVGLDTDMLTPASITTIILTTTQPSSVYAVTTRKQENAVVSPCLMNDVAVKIQTTTLSRCALECDLSSVDDGDSEICKFEVPSRYSPPEQDQSINGNILRLVPLHHASIYVQSATCLEWCKTSRSSLPDISLISHAMQDDTREMTSGDSVILLLSAIKCVEWTVWRHLWPPLPMEISCVGKELRPIPWPSFGHEQGALLLMPAWTQFEIAGGTVNVRCNLTSLNIMPHQSAYYYYYVRLKQAGYHIRSVHLASTHMEHAVCTITRNMRFEPYARQFGKFLIIEVMIILNGQLHVIVDLKGHCWLVSFQLKSTEATACWREIQVSETCFAIRDFCDAVFAIALSGKQLNYMQSKPLRLQLVQMARNVCHHIKLIPINQWNSLLEQCLLEQFHQEKSESKFEALFIFFEPGNKENAYEYESHELCNLDRAIERSIADVLRYGSSDLEAPWDPGGTFASAWGQADFQGGKNVMDRTMGQWATGLEQPKLRQLMMEALLEGKQEPNRGIDQQMKQTKACASPPFSLCCLP